MSQTSEYQIKKVIKKCSRICIKNFRILEIQRIQLNLKKKVIDRKFGRTFEILIEFSCLSYLIPISEDIFYFIYLMIIWMNFFYKTAGFINSRSMTDL